MGAQAAVPVVVDENEYGGGRRQLPRRWRFVRQVAPVQLDAPERRKRARRPRSEEGGSAQGKRGKKRIQALDKLLGKRPLPADQEEGAADEGSDGFSDSSP